MNVEVRLYNEAPIWQMVRLPREMWLMAAMSHMATDLSPLYVFRRDRPFSLSWGFDSVWERRWNHPQSQAVDLATVQAPNAADVVRLPAIDWR